MSVDLYYVPLSSPCRSIMMTARAVGVELNLKMTNPMSGDTRTPEFLKMNIQHTIPTMDDGGFCLNESRAICQYLVNKYGKDDSLYPKEPQARALVDARLYFDMGTLYSRFGETYYPAIFSKKEVSQESMDKLDEALGYLEHYLKDGYVAGDKLSIADLAVAASLSTVDACGHDMSKFPKVLEYLEKLKKEVDGFEELNQSGADQFAAIAKPALKLA